MPIKPLLRRRPARRRHGLALAVSVSLTTLLLTGCEESRYSMPAPASQQGQEVLQLWRASFYAAVALGILVLGLIFYSVIRHRRKGSDELPTQTEGNNLLELTYTFIPFVLVALLFFYGLQVQFTTTRLTNSAAAVEQPLVVDVTGYQWNWRFDYPVEKVSIVGGPQGEGDSSAEILPTMLLPVGERVRFNLTATDVNHSFFVRGFLTKRDLIPGINNSIELTPSRVGEYMGHCAEFCGLNHSQMNFRVHVVPRPEYDQWIIEQQRLTQQRQVAVS